MNFLYFNLNHFKITPVHWAEVQTGLHVVRHSYSSAHSADIGCYFFSQEERPHSSCTWRCVPDSLLSLLWLVISAATFSWLLKLEHNCTTVSRVHSNCHKCNYPPSHFSLSHLCVLSQVSSHPHPLSSPNMARYFNNGFDNWVGHCTTAVHQQFLRNTEIPKVCCSSRAKSMWDHALPWPWPEWLTDCVFIQVSIHLFTH